MQIKSTLKGFVSIYHGAIKSETLRIARSTIKEEEFINRTSNLVKRMINQGENLKTIRKHLNKTMTRNQECFKNYDSKQIDIYQLHIFWKYLFMDRAKFIKLCRIFQISIFKKVSEFVYDIVVKYILFKEK